MGSQSARTLNKEIGPVFIAAAMFLGHAIDTKIADYRVPEGATYITSIGVAGIGGRGYIYSPQNDPQKRCLVNIVGMDTCAPQ